LAAAAALGTTASPPHLSLNRHCPECEFRSRCRQIAIEADDLSLLAGVRDKERKRLHDKGVFTISQLSYTFRPKRHFKQIPPQRFRHEPALKALAIRKKQIHVIGTPRIDLSGSPVYFDVEGAADRDFYYLVGMRWRRGDEHVHRSFWANDKTEERRTWAACLETLRLIERPRLIHYGSYEVKFLKGMMERHCRCEDDKRLTDQLLSSSLNLLSLIYNQVYFPTYSNGLKEIARHLGFQWSEPDASGLGALGRVAKRVRGNLT